MKLKIGIDFDNTLIDYRKLFYRLAAEKGRNWIGPEHPKNKELIRKTLIQADGNDLRWQQLQAEAYGPRILEAPPFAGVREFIAGTIADGHELFVISHKTEVSNLDPTVSLRVAARAWLTQTKLGIPEHKIHFEATQDAKVGALQTLGCDFFIDDLLELLQRSDFPKTTLPVWFTPDGAENSPLLSFQSWAEILSFVKYCAKSPSPPATAAAIQRHGNSRLYRLTARDGTRQVLKKYPKPTRDFVACQFLWQQGFRDVPQPLWSDKEGLLAVFAQVEGEPPTEASPALIDQSAEFLLRLQRISRLPNLPKFGNAVDGRGRLRDYVDILEDRRARIESDPRGKAFFDARVKPLWTAALGKFNEGVRAAGLSADAPVPQEELMLSPSDFGLHNMLVCSGKPPVFLDFEYFGWDDPAKLVADYFHSVAQHVDWELKWRLLERMVAGMPAPDVFRQRWTLIVDLIGLEWVLIVLNVFDPEKMARKKFANPGIIEEDLIRERTKKAEELLERFAATRGAFLTIPDRQRA